MGITLLFAVVILLNVGLCKGGLTSSYRRKLAATVDMPLDSDVFRIPEGHNAPQQVHITQGDYKGRAMIISWVTPSEIGSKFVHYGLEKGNYNYTAKGTVTKYNYYNYTSGFIHHCTLKNLEHDTKYYYRLGKGQSAREFWFVTPPEVGPDAAYIFGIIGDLGQTYDSNMTFHHYMQSHGQTVLYVGDLSYADNYPNHNNVRWDSWGRFVEPSTAYQPWIWTAGNHELDYAPELKPIDAIQSGKNGACHDGLCQFILCDIKVCMLAASCFTWNIAKEYPHCMERYQSKGFGKTTVNGLNFCTGETEPFKPYLHRYEVPYASSNSTSPLWYSLKRASAHIIVLSSYSAYGKYTPQYRWLQSELGAVDRSKTPWLIVLLHSPWYNSNQYHYMEGETMRVQFEAWFVQYKVDIVFAGHVHAYERTYRVSNVAYNIVNGECLPVRNDSAPVYITIGDGGNAEGLAAEFTEPQPAYSAFREASFGHAILEIRNRTHAYYHWHRNADGEAVVADSYWLYNRHFTN